MKAVIDRIRDRSATKPGGRPIGWIIAPDALDRSRRDGQPGRIIGPATEVEIETSAAAKGHNYMWLAFENGGLKYSETAYPDMLPVWAWTYSDAPNPYIVEVVNAYDENEVYRLSMAEDLTSAVVDAVKMIKDIHDAETLTIVAQHPLWGWRTEKALCILAEILAERYPVEFSAYERVHPSEDEAEDLVPDHWPDQAREVFIDTLRWRIREAEKDLADVRKDIMSGGIL